MRRADVTSAWSGIRPLAVDPTAKDTASALRDHIVLQDGNGLITVTGTLTPCTRLVRYSLQPASRSTAAKYHRILDSLLRSGRKDDTSRMTHRLMLQGAEHAG